MDGTRFSAWARVGLLAVTLAAAALPCRSQTAAPARGDANGDGRVSVPDAVLVLRAAARLVTLPPGPADAADVNGDGSVNVQDAIRLLRALAGIEPLPSDPEPANVQVEADRSFTQVVGPMGGTLAATDADGVAYLLSIPPQAVNASVEITMTPVAGLQSAPAGASVPGGVHLLPEGLEFARPATLVVTLHTPPTESVAPVAYDGDGRNLRLFPARIEGNRAMFEVTHFSGYAMFMAHDIARLVRDFPEPSDIGDNSLALLVLDAMLFQGPELVEEMRKVLQGWMDGYLKRAAASVLARSAYDYEAFSNDPDGEVRRLRHEMLAFEGGWRFAGFHTEFAPAINAVHTEFAALVRDVAKHVIEVSNRGCSDEPDLAIWFIAPDNLTWQQLADYTGAAALDSTLKRGQVIRDLCVQPAYAVDLNAQIPDGIQPGQSVNQSILFGYRVNGGPVRLDHPMRLIVEEATNAVLDGPEVIEVLEDVDVKLAFRRSEDPGDMRLRVFVCLGGAYQLDNSCVEGVVERGPVVTECSEFFLQLGDQAYGPGPQQVEGKEIRTGPFDNDLHAGGSATSDGLSFSVRDEFTARGGIKYLFRVEAPTIEGPFTAPLLLKGGTTLDASIEVSFPGGSIQLKDGGGSGRFEITVRHGDLVRIDVFGEAKHTAGDPARGLSAAVGEDPASPWRGYKLIPQLCP